MKKAVVVLLVTALSLTMLAFLAGCGGEADKEEAKSLMAAGDAYMDAVITKMEELQTMQTDLAATAMGGDMSALTGEAGAAMQEAVAVILADIEASLTAANAEYEKILALEGVQDYKDYASKMSEAIDAYLEQLSYTTQLVDKLVDALIAMAQGQDIDIITLMMDSEELEKIEELGTRGDDLAEEANQIKLDKKLEQ